MRGRPQSELGLGERGNGRFAPNLAYAGAALARGAPSS